MTPFNKNAYKIFNYKAISMKLDTIKANEQEVSFVCFFFRVVVVGTVTHVRI